jgi:hypothetical protein
MKEYFFDLRGECKAHGERYCRGCSLEQHLADEREKLAEKKTLAIQLAKEDVFKNRPRIWQLIQEIHAEEGEKDTEFATELITLSLGAIGKVIRGESK